MLPRSHRLPAFDITRVMKRGARLTGKGIVLIYDSRNLGKLDSRLRGNDKETRGNDKKTTENETDVSRFAFIVSTKIDKRATVRNRIRRLLSESVRLLLPTIKKPIDCIFIARRDLVGLNQREIRERIEEMLQRLPVMPVTR